MTEILYQDFPDFWNLGESGFECDDGWFGLIYNMSLHLKLADFDAKIIQLKQKMGTLRIYIDTPPYGTSTVSAKQLQILREAEAKSEYVCEICGALGLLRNTLFIQVRCDKCQAKYLKQRNIGPTNQFTQ